MSYADLELRLQHWSGNEYVVELGFQLDIRRSEGRLLSSGEAKGRVSFDFTELRQLSQDAHAYGVCLARMLFADANVYKVFAEAQVHAQNAQVPLRLRLRFDAADDQLHGLSWETLREPERGEFFSTSERLIVSRYLDSATMTPTTIRPRANLKALVAVANPSGLEHYRLTPIKVADEVRHCTASLGEISTTILADGCSTRPTLNNIVDALRDGPDILYLVAHGTLRRERDGTGTERHVPYLWLEQEDGAVSRVKGEEFANILDQLARRPSLVILVSCQSAGNTYVEGALEALGPRLAASGIAAVVAMKGDISMDTIATFMPEFFEELQRDGQIDRAFAAARLSVLDRSDWWMPILFLRVRDGMLWSETPELPIPPLPAELYEPPEIVNFVGRKTELIRFQKKLKTSHTVVITGMPGVGKTTLAAVLARSVTERTTVFWYSFRAPGGIGIIIQKLAVFLARRGRDSLWRLWHSTDEQRNPESLLDHLIPMLNDQELVICLDNFQYVDEDPLTKQFFERLLPSLRQGRVSLILTTRRRPASLTVVIDHLEGLNINDTQDLLATYGVAVTEKLPPDAPLLHTQDQWSDPVELNTKQLVELHTATGGNAQLLILAIDLLNQGEVPETLIAGLSETDDVKGYLMTQVDKSLTDDERWVMVAVAVLLGYPATRDEIAAALYRPDMNLWHILYNLSSRSLLIKRESELDTLYVQHTIIRDFYYNCPSKSERVAMHLHAGEYYANSEMSKLRAALHFECAEEYARAADLATIDVWTSINMGRAGTLHEMLKRFVERQTSEDATGGHRLDREHWAAVQVALGRIYPYIGDLQLARQTNEATFKYLSGLPDSLTVRRLKAQICIEMGRLLKHELPETALEWLKQGLDIVKETGLVEQVAELHLLVGSLQIELGDYQEAFCVVNQGLDLLSEEAIYLRMGALINLGAIYYAQGDIEKAVSHAQSALQFSRQAQDDFRTISILSNLGAFKYAAGDWAGMIEDYHYAMALAEKLNNQVQRTRLEMNLGQVSLNQGDDEAALNHLTNSLTLAQEHHLHAYELACLSGLADRHLRRGEIEGAATLLLKAEPLARAMKNKYRQQEIHRWWSQVYLNRSQLQPAIEHAEQALTLSRALGNSSEEGANLRAYGQALLAAGRRPEALAAFEKSVVLLVKNPYEEARSKVQWGLVLRADRDVERAATLLEEARTVFERLGAQRDLGDINGM